MELNGYYYFSINIDMWKSRYIYTFQKLFFYISLINPVSEWAILVNKSRMIRVKLYKKVKLNPFMNSRSQYGKPTSSSFFLIIC